MLMAGAHPGTVWLDTQLRALFPRGQAWPAIGRPVLPTELVQSLHREAALAPVTFLPLVPQPVRTSWSSSSVVVPSTS